MKTGSNIIGVIGAALTLHMAAVAAPQPVRHDSSPSESIANLPEEITTKLSATEEAAHVERVARLRELQQERPTIEESAGAADSVSESALQTRTTERLIDALEGLQMEIRELKNQLIEQNKTGDQPDEEDSAGGTIQEDIQKPDTR